MKDPVGSTDPLNPAYPHDPGKVPDEPKSRLGSKANVTALVVIAVVVLVLVFLLAQDEATPEPATPAPTEMH